ncbi:hypothetical protein KHP62_12390 [Rhodobacteraceae bacterium NNCM2]|nr:hypothetical protein [Coraliihabitans acroporae]
MKALVILIGVVLTLLGLVLLGWSIFQAYRMKKATDLDEAAAKARLQWMIAVNMGGVGLGFFGLAVVMVGLFIA